MGSINYRAAACRLASEAHKTGLFSTSAASDEYDLKKMNPVFWADHKNVLKARTPGFGWWVWKPYFIMHCLQTIPEGDGLLYLDAGSIINTDLASVTSIAEFMKLTERQKVTGSNSDYYSEQLYTCNDLLDLLSLSPSQRVESQFCAAILFVVNDEEGRAFIRKWCELVCIDEHRWLLPKQFETENHPDFIHHMHDQASLSCLLKSQLKVSVKTGNKSTAGPILLARHRFGYSIDEKNLTRISYFKLLHGINRVYLAMQRRIHRSSLTIRPENHPLRIPN